ADMASECEMSAYDLKADIRSAVKVFDELVPRRLRKPSQKVSYPFRIAVHVAFCEMSTYDLKRTSNRTERCRFRERSADMRSTIRSPRGRLDYWGRRAPSAYRRSFRLIST